MLRFKHIAPILQDCDYHKFAREIILVNFVINIIRYA